MKNHWLWMIIGCVLPLLLIFLAPSIGLGGDVWLFTFIIVMFAIHLMMPMRHGDHTHGLSDENLREKNNSKDQVKNEPQKK
ncbi:hypothetical protein FK178_05230 [Antarcticibacterium arcticum]|uniref:DUF2933 domain-containing protein n=1 Tax=Antarcticibacterium arcticum TaxID=2585771 RepID=A0A5B8YJ89_9FLAO|nr:hypothetical protein [Antarcticibacterium arcticum]QED37148.1 hypothetical protein FK178_05230 [Antarcticibacterium arcticum]